MSDIVNDFFKRFYPSDAQLESAKVRGGFCGIARSVDGVDNIFPMMVCADGFSMSVQGHYGAYSIPRDDFALNYTSVEVGYPSERIAELMPYIDGDPNTIDPTNTLYGYVPVDVVVSLIEKHNGLKPEPLETAP